MVAVKVDAFGGMLPAVDDRLLPDHAAALSQNAYLYSGKLQGTYAPQLLRTNSSPATARVFRIPNNFTDAQHLTDAVWLEFQNPDTDVIRAPLVGDSFSRYYWASSSGQPQYNTLARIKSNTNPLLLGVPQPAVAPGVTPTGGSSATTEARSYVYTYQTQYGEEGPPSAPTVVTGKIDATWAITLTAPTTTDVDGTNRQINHINIYRTVTSAQGVATYFFVAQVSQSTASYNDTAASATVAGNNQLLSTTWTAPPTDLQGFVAMPNGIVAAWRSNEIWFCEPYRPHAWPAQYAVACDYPIIGLGVVGQTLVACTEGFPHWAYGVSPATMTLGKIQAPEPCLSRGSILSSPEGVYYASPNGLILVANGRAANITRQFLTKDKWLNIMGNIATLRAARLGTAYYAWGSQRSGVFEPTAWDPSWVQQQDFSGARSGVLIELADQRVAVTTLSGVDPVSNVMNDPWTGEVFIVRNGRVYWLNIGDSDPIHEPYVWRSKVFQTTNRRNLAAVRIFFEVPDTVAAQNPNPTVGLNQTLQSGQYGLLRVYAGNTTNEVDQLVMTRELRSSGELIRLPSGFKADFWQFEINAYVSVYSFQTASSVKEMAKV